MASTKLDAAARPLPFSSGERLRGSSRPDRDESRGGAADLQRYPTAVQLVRRSGLPLMMIVIVAGTPLWGGYVTLGLAFVLWRLAGVAL